MRLGETRDAHENRNLEDQYCHAGSASLIYMNHVEVRPSHERQIAHDTEYYPATPKPEPCQRLIFHQRECPAEYHHTCEAGNRGSDNDVCALLSHERRFTNDNRRTKRNDTGRDLDENRVTTYSCSNVGSESKSEKVEST